MNKPIKVLQVVSSFGMGGAETWMLEMVKYWKNSGIPIQVDFLVTRGAQDLLDNEVSKYGSHIFYSRLDKRNVFRFSRDLRKILKTGGYSAIHDHQDILSGWHFAAAIGRLPKVRITHFHNPAYQWTHNYGVSTRRRMILKIGKSLIQALATDIRGTSKQLLDEAELTTEPFKNHNPSALHCAFDVVKWQGSHEESRQTVLEELGWPASTRLILFAGRLDYSTELNHPQNHKNSVFALKVFAEASKRDDNLKLIMAGANDFVRDRFEALVSKENLVGRVKLLGIRRDLPRLMLASNLLLFPSRAEGLGMVAVEAQAAGLPVLASTAVPKECVVLPELVCFLDLNAPVDQWAAQVLQIVHNPRPPATGNREEWAHSAFNIENCAKRLEQLYSGARPC